MISVPGGRGSNHRFAFHSPARASGEEPTFRAPEGLGDHVADLEAALAELPDEQRQVIVLRIWGGLTLEETAEVVGVPAPTVASRYRYALQKMKQRMTAVVRS